MMDWQILSWWTWTSLFVIKPWQPTTTDYVHLLLKTSTLCHWNWKRKWSCSLWRMRFCTAITTLRFAMMIQSKHISWRVEITANWPETLEKPRHYPCPCAASHGFQWQPKWTIPWWLWFIPKSKISHPEVAWYPGATLNTSRTMDRHQLQFDPSVSVVWQICQHIDSDWPTGKDGALYTLYRDYGSWATGQPDVETCTEASQHIKDCVWTRKCLHISVHKATPQTPRYLITHFCGVPSKDWWAIRIPNQTFEQHVCHFTQYYQDD